jgi:hypothetical protein
MKFTTLIPTNDNDGTIVPSAVLTRIVRSLWLPFGGMTNEGLVEGHWVDEGRHFVDLCMKISIECERHRLSQALRAVKRIGRKLGQRAMYFEVSGYDGVQVLRLAQDR